ncbi:MAG: DUF262 domain-containing protein [Selenomonadaceae bacterium]|nr:DUF262 domain-containing protein [Selenomonadaceae bacterium]
MTESLRTFMNIFSDGVKQIVIPNIQRDYAQGRNTTEIRRVRERFLDALYKAVTTDASIKLDFVYGSNEDGTLTLLDGQQRLTTLFLLHWYAAKKENIPLAETEFLKKFLYDTRPDSREFCKFLIAAKVSFGEKLSAEIEDNADFPLSWKKDPTVSSMLVILDAIDEKFCDVENLWAKLKDGAISFYFLPIDDMGLTDEIYVTMNSRGKPLTDFEHFKAEFKSRLDEIDGELSDRIILKIDTDWTDLLWDYRDEDNLIDDGFLAYFGFLCDVILYRKDDTPQGKSRDPFDLLKEFFNGDVRENVDFMERSFDCWYELSKREKISAFFADRVSTGSRTNKFINRHECGKIITYFDRADFFGDCVKFSKKLSLGQTVMLYAFQTYLLNVDKISDADFRRRIRIVNNLVENSKGAELSNSENRNNGNRIPAMLEQVDSIIIYGKILERDKIRNKYQDSFNSTQLEEERKKLLWTAENPDKAESLFELEDHYLLYGQIGIIGLGYPEYFERFISLFKCQYDKISCALLIMGDYLQTMDRKVYQLGSPNPKSWQNLFHKSALVRGFEDTKEFLEKLLRSTKNFDNDYLNRIIDEYLAKCERDSEFDWIYYHVSYPSFRAFSIGLKDYGKYCWWDFEHEPYCFAVMSTEKRLSTNSYQPFLKEVEVNDNISREHLGMRLIFGDYYVECENDSYVVKNLETDKEEDRLTITQRKIGDRLIDTEDRIKKFAEWAKGYLY